MKQGFLAFLIVSTVAASAHAEFLDETRVLHISVSDEGLTRISVQDAKIQDVFLHPSHLAQNVQLHKSGHVFLAPEGLQGPVSLTIITDRDQTQDLKIRFQKGRKTAPVILRARPKKEVTPLPGSQVQDVGLILKEFLEGVVPKGFSSKLTQGEERSALGATFREARRFSNGRLEALSMTFKNGRKNEVNLDEKAFSKATDLGVAFEKRRVRPEETTTLWILREEKK